MNIAGRVVRQILSLGFPLIMTAAVVVLDFAFRGGDFVKLSTLVAITILSGVSSMVVIETAKRLLPIRAWYQKDLVVRYMPRSDETAATSSVRLRRYAGSIGSIYNLPTEQMIAQVAARRRLEQEVAARESTSSDSSSPPFESNDSAVDNELDDAQLFNQIHVLVAGRWRHYVRTTAVWLSGAIALLLTSIHVSGIPNSRSIPITALIFGGFVAWVARDITAVVERMRR